MRVEKELSVPVSKRRAVRYPVSGWKRWGLTLRHMRAEGNALVCAEGENASYELTDGTTELFATPSTVFGYVPSENRLYWLGQGIRQPGIASLNAVAEFTIASGTYGYGVGDSYIYRFSNGATGIVSSTYGGSCIAFHYERLYIAAGYRLYYSPAVSVGSFKDMSAQEAGYVDLPSSRSGDILGLFSFREKLYLLRERGITAVAAFGNTLNFKATEIPCSFGVCLEKSAALCGEKLYFFTDRGLHAFDGSTCSRVENACDGAIDLTASVRGAECRGVYFASVCGTDGVRRIYSYDPGFGCGRYVEAENESLAANTAVYYMRDGALYTLGGRALPEGGECSATLTFSLSAQCDGEKFLEAVVLEGEGTFRVEAVSQNGSVYAAEGEAGRRLRFSEAVRGEEVTLRIIATDAAFRLRAVTLCVRREALHDD